MSAFAPDVSLWDAWRPEDVARLFARASFPWYVAAGWAIDLFIDGESREHEDLEIAVPNYRFGEVERVLDAFEILVVTAPKEVTPLPEARGRLTDTHQTWVRDPKTGRWRLDVFREPSQGDSWICRRDPSIRMPYDELIEWTDDGIPYGRPEIVLLFKAKHAHEAKNERDFAETLPRLDAARREWLHRALERVHPGHSWVAELERVAA